VENAPTRSSAGGRAARVSRSWRAVPSSPSTDGQLAEVVEYCDTALVERVLDQPVR
jgi:hypothetical protein